MVSDWEVGNPKDKGEAEIVPTESPEARLDRFGLMAALFLLSVAFFAAALWSMR
jgi:hypothetical protein